MEGTYGSIPAGVPLKIIYNLYSKAMTNKTTTEKINELIRKNQNTNRISDGHHTFGELYEHRFTLYIALCRDLDNQFVPVWKSKYHSDGTRLSGWFILGIFKEKGKQITYHLPIGKWDETDFAEELHRAPEFDGHTSEDVLERLKKILT